MRDGNVERISTQGATVDGQFKKDFTYQDKKPTKAFETEIPIFANSDELSKLLEDKGVTIEAEPVNQSRGFLASLILGFGPVILLIGLFVYFARRAGGGGAMSALGSFGRSRARRAEGGEQKITFADVAGIDEAKSELSEIVDFLKNPERYQKLGGRIPKGVLLSGRPGTGKTLLARAVAGEANVPFFCISASEFVEAIVGIGASRVRDLFKQAKEAAPAIIFIDELDAIGRTPHRRRQLRRRQRRARADAQPDPHRDGRLRVQRRGDRARRDQPAGDPRRRAAAPRPLRPPRRRPAARQGRPREHPRRPHALLPLADDVNLDRLAATTPGMVGADLANLANEAALMAARRRHEKVQQADFTDALEKIVLGAPRGTMLSDEDRRRVAYHEAGHALVGMLTPGADPVRKVSIIPRGQALGVTFSAPDDDRANYEESWLRAKIKVALGGRVAEEIVFGTITTGAESDIQQLTQIARGMVGRWGMSAVIGPIAVLPPDEAGPLLPGSQAASETTQRLVDEEVRRIVEESYAEVQQLLTDHRDQLDSLTEALLRDETLDEDPAYAAAQVTRGIADTSADNAATSAPARG